MQLSVKLAPTFDYATLEHFWRTADDLGFPAVWNYDHFYGLVDPHHPDAGRLDNPRRDGGQWSDGRGWAAWSAA